MTTPKYAINRATPAQIIGHLQACNQAFIPPLSGRVDVDTYGRKIAEFAVRFEAWADDWLIALVAMYCNDQRGGTAFVTNVSVNAEWQGRGIASRLLATSIEHARHLGCGRIELELDCLNQPAAKLYKKHGFSVAKSLDKTKIMTLFMEMEANLGAQRDYDSEINDASEHRYAYDFDFDVMHSYMLRSFEPFFRPGSLLELGSFKGDFTRRLLARFDDITCVEASAVALDEARHKLGNQVCFVHSTLEAVNLPKRYDNIVITHVLEHIDDPVGVLRRVNDEWLAEEGRLFLTCPNANAPSRQIAVLMGLISHNAAVTSAEAEHGHRRTYSLDSLERDARAAGLNVVHRSGIFFKALANFQWDQVLQTNIISKEYLEGCYKLGQKYPDLCASIFLMSERGLSGESC